MIVKMAKVYIITEAAQRGPALDALADLGVVHLAPVDPAAAVPSEKTVTAVDTIARALQVLSQVEPSGPAPDIGPLDAASEVIRIERESAENNARLAALHRQIVQLQLWGNVSLEQFQQLRDSGVNVTFVSLPAHQFEQIQADCSEIVGKLPGKRVMVAIVQRDGETRLPESAENIPLPLRDRPSLRAEAAETDRRLEAAGHRLAELAHLVGEMQRQKQRLNQQADFTVAERSGLAGKDLFAIQGWAPAAEADALSAGLAAGGVDAAVRVMPPAEDDEPPTLIRYPKWARPIKGLFDMLGTVAGYREFDVAAPFMLALPIFAAMLIGDGGYGAVLLLGPLLMWKKVSKSLGADFTRLLIVIGGVALVWGLLCASFFGVVLYRPLIPVNMTDESRSLMMRISFFMGAIHLAVAQLWRGISYWPSLKGLSSLGWAIFIWGMLGVVKYFVLNDPLDTGTVWIYLLAVGAVLAILFDSPSRNPFKMLGMGLANFPLSMLSAFSDVISYVRLMAVGLASGVLASSFNELALSTGHWLIAAPILVAGHGLTLGLALIALFAHGVRLNMLEFSNNLGMQWTGQAYAPFGRAACKEIQR